VEPPGKAGRFISACASGALAQGLQEDHIQSTESEVPPVRYSTQVKPISYLKANAAEVLERINEVREPMVITQNGEARAVLQDLASWEQTQETLALLKLLALGQQDIEAGRTKPAAEVVARLRRKTTPRG
jgi:prevent-host-death family protein